jgi:3-dehydroquinate synthase
VRSIDVALGERSYAITLGSGILTLRSWWQAVARENTIAIVSDQRVAPHYLEQLSTVLRQLGRRVVPVVVAAGEPEKNWGTLDAIHGALLGAGCDRHTLIVALGGGVIGDLAGFAAATYQRGVPFVQVPTTLLAQVDSSIGGKTGINHALGKNMVGAFYQPRAVLIDVATLATLPARELAAGMAEVIKHAAVADESYLTRVEKCLDQLLDGDGELLIDVIARSCEIKAEVVAADERESGRRAILNFGHTFGHAIEAGLGYGTWLHGEAVACGMVQGAHLSRQVGSLAAADVARLEALLDRCRLPVRAPDLGIERWLELMARDKKAAEGAPRFVLLRGLGDAYVEPVAAEIVREVLLATASVPVSAALRDRLEVAP